jgi:chromosome segregation ATPase
VAALTESLELMKEQSKTKMMAAIDKMKELKGNFTAKVEEVNVGSLKISELEATLAATNQEVLKYKGAMEKAMPKFRELKSELDAKTQENVVMQNEKSLLENKIKELESTVKSRDQNSTEENLLDISDIHESALSGVECIAGGNPMKASERERERSLSPVTQSIPEDSQEKKKTDGNDKDSVDGLKVFIADLQAKYEDFRATAGETESGLKSELMAMRQASMFSALICYRVLRIDAPQNCIKLLLLAMIMMSRCHCHFIILKSLSPTSRTFTWHVNLLLSATRCTNCHISPALSSHLI